MTNTRIGRGRHWLVAFLLVASTPAAAAQTGAATVTGIVTTGSDQAGNVASAAGVTVTANHVATSGIYTSVTTGEGAYTISGLSIGTYNLTVSLPGFKTSQATVLLSASQAARVDFRLEVGAIEEIVQVRADSMLQTEDAVVGTRLGVTQVEDLPTAGRNPGNASLFAPGATTPNPTSFNTFKDTFGGRPYVNGQREQANTYTLDGVDINDPIDNFVVYQPSLDAIEQIRIETSNYSPDLGNVAGAVVNIVLKSGADQLEGNAFYTWRDNALAAAQWETNRLGGRKPDFTRTFFGGTVGGPIARSKLFFFGDYQGGRQDLHTPIAFSTVAPEPWRMGDLSSLLGNNLIARDPMTGQPFPNNQIPVDRFGPFARALFANPSLYPRPNVGRSLSDFRSNYQGSSGSSEEADQFDLKINWNASRRDKMWVRYSFQNHHSRTDQTVMPLLFGTLSTNPYRGLGASWNRHGRSILNELLIGYNANAADSEPLDLLELGPLNPQFGIPGAQPIAGLSEVQLGNSVSTIGTAAVTSSTHNRMLQVNERLTWIHGRHAWKLGATWQYSRMRRYFSGNNGVLGQFGFDGSFTGVPFADFLLDLVSTKGRGSLSEAWTHLQHRLAFYGADDFKVARGLTLNLGLRWAYSSPLVEKDDRQTNFDLTNARQLFAGRDGNSRALYQPYYHGWEPRTGLAYRPGERWVVRGGYGISQSMEGTGANLRLPLNPPFFFESQARYDRTSGAGTMTSGFDGLRALDTPSGQVRAWDPELRPQFTQQWNVFVESRVGTSASLSIGYLGSAATHIVTPIDGNQPRPGVGDPLTWAPLQERRPLFPFNPSITSVSTTASKGRARYNALQTIFQGRLGTAFQVLANYSLSRAFTNNAGYYGSSGVAAPSLYPMTSADIERDYGPAFFDATHVASFLATYAPRFRRDGPPGNGWTRVAGGILDGWSVTVAATLHSGYPITVIDGSNPSLQGSRGSERPNLVGDPTPDQQTLQRWIDRRAFASAALGQFGNAAVGVVRAPGYQNIDLSLTKRVGTISHGTFVVRCEAYNVFNVPSFGPPVANIQSQNFGTISTTVNTPRIVQLVVKYHF